MTETAEEVVQLGVGLLRSMVDDEIDLSDALDRIETITTNPDLQRQILQTAEQEGVIERDYEAKTVTLHGESSREYRPSSESDGIVVREGEFSCRRCGESLSTGYFMQFDSTEHGPFGSTCIRKVTGRE